MEPNESDPAGPVTDPPAGLTDEHAEVLLADAIAAAEQLNQDEPPAAQPKSSTLPDDPTVLKDLIAELRRENAEARVAKKSAAEAARTEIADQIGRTLGFVKDNAPVDPGELMTQLTAAQQAARQSSLELAVYQAADAAEANPAALLDSRKFLASVSELDPSDTTSLVTAMSEAIEQNPLLGRGTQQPRVMKPNPAQGRSASPPESLQERVVAAEKAGNVRESLRLKSAQLLGNDPNQP